MPDVTVNVDAPVTAVEIEETTVSVEVIEDSGEAHTVEITSEEIAFVEVLVPGPPGPPGPPGAFGEPDVPSLTLLFENRLV